MKTSRIALQLYTLRDHTGTAADFAETCRKVSAIGYRAVQLSAIDYSVVPEEEAARICADHGLAVCATHEPPDMILNEPARVVERLGKLGTRITAYPFPAGVDLGDERSVAELISGLDRSGKVLADAGMALTYHNHHHEFRRIGGRLILERIYAETDPKHLQAEIDTYWIQYGGGDPAGWCSCLRGRLPIIHLKDFRINDRSEIEFAEIGHGNLDMPGIIRAAEEAGCGWFVVEQDTCPGDPFESVRMSFDSLRAMAED